MDGTGSATADTGIVKRKTDRSVKPELVSAGTTVAITRGGRGPDSDGVPWPRGSSGQTDTSPLWSAGLDQPRGVYLPASASSASARVIIKVSGSTGDAPNP
jgi:hypothetical protein